LLEGEPVLWLEDPVPPENVEALASVTRNTTTPIATGENSYLAVGFEPMILAGAVDIVAPDLQKVGGLGEPRVDHQFRARHVAVDPRIAQFLERAHLLDGGMRRALDQIGIAAHDKERQIAAATVRLAPEVQSRVRNRAQVLGDLGLELFLGELALVRRHQLHINIA